MSLGVIGGLGPMATAYFMELIIQMTKADKDQEHLEMIIYNWPTIPDRTAYILGRNPESPLPEMTRIGKALKEQDVECIAIPCITAHYFHNELEDAIGLPIVHAIRDTAATLRRAGVRKAGIMATDGTIESHIFQDALVNEGLSVVLPSADIQKKVMSIIYDGVKAGKPISLEDFHMVRDYMRSQGAEVIILGCTELSVVKRDYPQECRRGFIDAMEVLAKSSVLACGREVREEYESLFTPFDTSENDRR